MSLDVQGLSVTLGTRAVVTNASFAVATGELAFMIGPNGVGKTTILRAIAGLIGSSGQITLSGRPLATLPATERARALAYIPQGHVAHWPLAARDVVAIGRRPHLSSLAALGEADRACVDTALAAVDASAYADRAVTELSGGERARVMLARALAVEAPVILADEPVAALDPRHQLAVTRLLKNLAGQGRTIVVVAHDLTLAARFADRIIVMQSGGIAACGPPSQVLTDALLADVFGITAARFKYDGAEVVTPWHVAEAE